MINVLIVDDNVRYAITLMNYINKTNDNIKVYSIAENGKKALDIINKQTNIDVILLDLKMPVCSGLEVIELISDKNKYESSIIIISGEIGCIQQICENNMIYSILYKTANMDKIICKINELVESKIKRNFENKTRNKIINEILKLNYDISNVGTIYLINAIEYVITNMPNKEFNNLTSEVYPYVARYNNTSTHNVKNNIVRATTKMYCQCEINTLKEYFHYSDDVKPDARTVIRTIINKVS